MANVEDKTEESPELTKTLRFMRPDLERSYVDLMSSEDTSQLKVPRYRKRVFGFVGAVVALYTLMLISNQYPDPSDSARLVQLTLSTVSLVLVFLALPLLLYCSSMRLPIKVSVYLAALVSLAAFDSHVTVALTTSQSFSENLSSFLPALSLAPFLLGLLDYHAIHFLILSSLGGLLIFVCEAGSRSSAYPLLSLTIYEMGCGGLGYIGYLLEMKLRMDFNISAVKPVFTRQATMHPELQEGTVGIELEAIIHDLWKVQSFIKDCAFSSRSFMEKERANSTVTIVKNILFRIRSRNIYEVTAENLPHEWGKEETEFVKENYVAQKLFVESSKRESEYSTWTPVKHSVRALIPILCQIGLHWNLDSDSFGVWAAGRPISNVATYLFKCFHIHTRIPLEKKATRAVFKGLEERYLPNPYHNAVHATDVVMSMMYLMKETGVISQATDLEIAAIITSALAHDVGHPGVNNRFLQNTQHSLSLECNPYPDNDVSPLEMMHSSILFNLIASEKAALGMSLDMWGAFRKMGIEMILATDMGKHFETVGMLRAMIAPVKLDDAPTRLFLYRILLKCSDIGHSAKEWSLHERWSLRITEEFFRQGDSEKASRLPVSMFCDRVTTDISKVVPT